MYKICFALLFLVSAVPAWADDAVEAAATGNIMFEKTPDIMMQDETLTISKSAAANLGEDKFSVDVDFHFKNTSNHDITRKIAFVLPPVQCSMEFNSMWAGLDLKTPDQANNNGLKDFITTVNGKSQPFTTRSVAMMKQNNITALLNKLQIPLNPCKVQTAPDGSPNPKYGSNLQKYHLMTEDNEPAWSENIYFEWEQRFPAGQSIDIHHHYTPVIGAAVPSPRSLNELNTWFSGNLPPFAPIWSQPLAALNDIKPSLIYTKNDLAPNNNQPRYCVMPEWVRYKLTTGAYWHGGIKTFKL
ncbi:MAG: DUF4424 family protein, partial [Gammaproteobacteria bacterium]